MADVRQQPIYRYRGPHEGLRSLVFPEIEDPVILGPGDEIELCFVRGEAPGGAVGNWLLGAKPLPGSPVPVWLEIRPDGAPRDRFHWVTDLREATTLSLPHALREIERYGRTFPENAGTRNWVLARLSVAAVQLEPPGG